MITIVDYGLGNVQAIANIYQRLDIPVRVARSATDLGDSRKLILPGVGAFDWAMRRLQDSGMREGLDELVTRHGSLVLGICVGMQMMAQRSDEGVCEGLGWIAGEVKLFDTSAFTAKTHLPHMGWNDVAPKRDTVLFRGLESDARFYFLHSYCFLPAHTQDVLAVTDYNGSFASGVIRDNVFGVQFHPEKSHHWGVRLLKNFSDL
jgi:imidazole glycerol-phosphate synthase subunit HisH